MPNEVKDERTDREILLDIDTMLRDIHVKKYGCMCGRPPSIDLQQGSLHYPYINQDKD